MDDLTPEQLDQLRSRENPWSDPFTRRELRAEQDYKVQRMQQELHEKVNGRWHGYQSLETRLASAADAGEQQRWTGPYKEIGIHYVELAQIKNIPAPGSLSFEKTSEAEMIEGFRKLGEIEQQPETERLQFCMRQDVEKQLADRDGYQHVYNCFYGNDSSGCIKLVQVAGGYEIDSGRHRVYVARELGAQSVPARVWVPDRS